MKRTPATHCDHANEAPMACPCAANCYCRAHTCRLLITVDAETRPLLATAKRAAAEVAAWPAWKRNELPREETAVKPRNRRARNAMERELLEAGQSAPSTAAVNAQLQTPEAWRALWADCMPEPRR